MLMTMRLLACIALSTAGLLGCSGIQAAHDPSTAIAENHTSEKLPEKSDETGDQRLLTTQDFESGRCVLSTVSSAFLEPFLQDLHRRKDYDAACHNGNPGPDADYLSGWIDMVTRELLARGYFFDTTGNLHRPSPIVPLR
jgi:hypothetical protein